MLVEAKAHDPVKNGGKRKLLAGNLAGYWSKRIDGASRLLYRTSHHQIVVIAYRFQHPH